MNEPQVDGFGATQRWRPIMLEITERARAAAPNVPLVVTPHGRSDFQALLEFEPFPTSLGQVVYTFHYYYPSAFTHQLVVGRTRHVGELEWPPNPAQRAAQIAAAERRVAADRTLSAAERAEALSEARRTLTQYYDEPLRPADIATDFNRVAAWADRHRIPRAAILLGEFGVVREFGGLAGAKEESRLLWLSTVRREAERCGFGWSVWTYRGSGGMAFAEERDPRNLDVAGLRALGLTP